MAGQGRSTGMGSGPGNRIIAATVLEWLALRGQAGAHERASRMLGEAGLVGAGSWLADDVIAGIFAAGEVDASLARAMGHRLVTPEATGLRLYGLGLATPEKAYRRVQALLPRASARAQWTVEAIESQSARLRFELEPGGGDASAGGSKRRAEESLCALRRGMLEAIPGLYGLLPAEVVDVRCRAKGDPDCCYDLQWRTLSRHGVLGGFAIGLGIAAGLGATAVFLGGPLLVLGGSFAAIGLSGLSAVILGITLGRVYDLTRQLDAVAGARRGHLALFDQVDDALAAKLDALARAEAKLEGELSPSPVRRPGRDGTPDPVSTENHRGMLAAAQQIHAAAGDLECWFERLAENAGEGSRVAISEERGLVREIREWAARIGQLGAPDGQGARVPVDLAALVGRAVATARPSLAPSAVIEVEADADLRRIECEPVPIESVVIALVRNAVEASVELSESPRVTIQVSNCADGVELAVADRGVGIEASEIDEVFDPFFGDGPIGTGGGRGLTACLEIIERHGGELRIENQDRAGTRISVRLPVSGKEEPG